MPSATHRAPSTKLRAAIYESINQRYSHAQNIWYVYSNRMRRHWILRNDLQFLHFLLIEFLPDITSFDLAPAPVETVLNDELVEIEFAAKIEYRDGRIECLSIGTDPCAQRPEAMLELNLRQAAAARKLGGVHRRVSASDIEPQHVRVRNGLRMLRFIVAARHTELSTLRNAVMLRVKGATGPFPLDTLVRALPGHAALATAAVFQLYQMGRLALDIDRNPLTGMTSVGLAP